MYFAILPDFETTHHRVWWVKISYVNDAVADNANNTKNGCEQKVNK